MTMRSRKRKDELEEEEEAAGGTSVTKRITHVLVEGAWWTGWHDGMSKE